MPCLSYEKTRSLYSGGMFRGGYEGGGTDMGGGYDGGDGYGGNPADSYSGGNYGANPGATGSSPADVANSGGSTGYQGGGGPSDIDVFAATAPAPAPAPTPAPAPVAYVSPFDDFLNVIGKALKGVSTAAGFMAGGLPAAFSAFSTLGFLNDMQKSGGFTLGRNGGPANASNNTGLDFGGNTGRPDYLDNPSSNFGVVSGSGEKAVSQPIAPSPAPAVPDSGGVSGGAGNSNFSPAVPLSYAQGAGGAARVTNSDGSIMDLIIPAVLLYLGTQ